MADATQLTRFRVDGMDCAGCAMKIETAVRRIPGVAEATVSVMAGTLAVRHDPQSDLGDMARKVEGLGYRVGPLPAKGPAAPPAPPVPSAADDEDHDHDDHDAGGEHADEEHHGHAHVGGDHHDHAHGNVNVAGLHGRDHGPLTGPWYKSPKGLLTIGSGAALVVAFAAGKLVPDIESWAFMVAMLIGLVPIARRALMAALSGMPFTIETLMTIAAVGAVFIGAAEEAAAVVFLFLVGELLEGVAAGKARSSIQALTQLVPTTALLEVNGTTRDVPAETLTVGSIIMVRPGDRISADGVIVGGESEIDESAVTGESISVRKGVDATVFAGTMNGDAVIRVRVTAAAANNTIARLVRLVEEAQESKAPTERFIDSFSRWYTPGVLVVGFLVAVTPPLFFGGIWNEWIYKGLAVLLIGCPCALVISTPAAIAASLAAGARRGLLLKGGAVLEQLGKITAVAFDKTGTLTEGKPKVTDVLSFGLPEAEVIRLAAALEAGSSHPLATAILARAVMQGTMPPSATRSAARGGKGVSGIVEGIEVYLGSPRSVAERVGLSAAHEAAIASLNDAGKTVSVLIAGGVVAGAIALRDEPRPDAMQGLRDLAAEGIKVVMLTGDNRRVAEAIGTQLRIEPQAELLPEDKQRIVLEMKAGGFVVAKVGDGINDAPALAAADVGIAMGSGTDVALETADAAILHGRVADVAAMVVLSKRTMANIRQNITIALGLKAVFLVTTVIGVTGLWPAILADTGATVLVTFNALRLLGGSQQPRQENPSRQAAAKD